MYIRVSLTTPSTVRTIEESVAESVRYLTILGSTISHIVVSEAQKRSKTIIHLYLRRYGKNLFKTCFFRGDSVINEFISFLEIQNL